MVLVLGPTGSGKSGLAIRLALEFDGEIINCDSQQVYRGLNIGTAKVTEAERRGVPHHLIDVADPDEVFSAGEYARRARTILNEIRDRGRLPIVCGGTGFYVRGLLEGFIEGPRRDERLRDELNRRELRRAGFVHRLLRRLDPQSALRIHSNDTQKAVRAVEVSMASRAPMTTLFGLSEQPLHGFRWLKLGLDPARDLLYTRINERCVHMVNEGLIEEAAALLARGYGRDAKALESIGYRQALAVLDGTWSLEQALSDTQMETRRYAKRQLTWFRRDGEIRWLKGFGHEVEIELEAIRRVREHLNSTSGQFSSV